MLGKYIDLLRAESIELLTSLSIVFSFPRDGINELDDT
jgi:hypothetical protein